MSIQIFLVLELVPRLDREGQEEGEFFLNMLLRNRESIKRCDFFELLFLRL